MKIGFIGTGVMGSSMVRNLLKNGYEVSVYNRSKEKALPLREDGAIVCDSLEECIKDKGAIITIVGFPKDVKECQEKAIELAKEGTILIDMTTSSPTLARELYLEAKNKGLAILDAPVTGGDVGAKKGTLSIMVGGDREVYDKAYPIFAAMGKTIQYMGEAGSGQNAKMANQIAVAGTLAGVLESIAYIKKSNLDLTTVLNSISKGAAASCQMDLMIDKVLNDDFTPGFYVKHIVKDLTLAEQEAARNGLKLDVLRQILKEYQKVQDMGYQDLGTQALLYYYLNS